MRLLLGLLLSLISSAAFAQDTTCPTRPAGDSTNACASTAFVAQNALPLGLTQNFIIVGSSGNLAVGVPLSGSCSIVSAGALSCNANALTGTALAAGVVTSSLTAVGAINTGTWNDTSTGTGLSNASKFFNPTFFGNAATGVVHRFNRVKVGVATLSSSDIPQSTFDWLETLQQSDSSQAQLVSISVLGSLGISGASRTSDFPFYNGIGSHTGGAQGVTGFALNDDLTGGAPIAAGFNGQAVKYAQNSSTVTITNASPAVVTWTNHNLTVGQTVYFSSTGTLPSPLVPGTDYFIIAGGLTTNAFEISLTSGGAAITTTTVGSGTFTSVKTVGAVTSTVTTNSPSTPVLITWTNHNLTVGTRMQFTTTGTLPAGLSLVTDYFIIAAGLTANSFEVSASQGGAAINTTTAGSGTHTASVSAGGVTLNQMDIMTLTPSADVTPFGGVVNNANFAAGFTSGAFLGLGPPQKPSAAAYIGLGSQAGPPFRKGLIVFDGSLDPTVGAGGDGVAVEMARGQSIRGLNSGGTTDGEITFNANGVQFPTDQAWTSFTATPTCGTATITTNSAKRKTLGKTTFVELDINITVLGTCTNGLTLILPNTPNSGGGMAGRGSTTGRGLSCGISNGSTTAACINSDSTNFGTGQISMSGVYENQ